MKLTGYSLLAIAPIKAYYLKVVGLKLTDKQIVSMCIKSCRDKVIGEIDIKYRSFKVNRLIDKRSRNFTLSEEDSKMLKSIQENLGLKGVPLSFLLGVVLQETGKAYRELCRLSNLSY